MSKLLIHQHRKSQPREKQFQVTTEINDLSDLQEPQDRPKPPSLLQPKKKNLKQKHSLQKMVKLLHHGAARTVGKIVAEIIPTHASKGTQVETSAILKKAENLDVITKAGIIRDGIAGATTVKTVIKIEIRIVSPAKNSSLTTFLTIR